MPCPLARAWRIQSARDQPRDSEPERPGHTSHDTQNDQGDAEADKAHARNDLKSGGPRVDIAVDVSY